METIDVLGIPVAKLTLDQARAQIVGLHDRAEPALCAYVNAHSINLAHSNPEYRQTLLDADLVLADGAGLAIAARVRGDRFPANLNGSDFNPVILEEAARHGWPVFLLGARPGVAERAAGALRARMPGLDICGTHDGYFSDGAAIAREVRSAAPSLVMVAMGNPAQELWLRDYLDESAARVGVGVGAFFDFVAGEVPRAPAWMNRLGVEWVYRLAQEPRRMWRRYILGNPVFLWRVLAARFKRR
ncbi:MAG: WecB/TagA/CpsF family glycosyltransferase [Actinomycetota bacterium]|nr:WecB/TagA/CpsF family glycosyltransferase [Actinomycetota bacterium]